MTEQTGVSKTWTVDLATRVRDLRAEVQIGKVPAPIAFRADQLCGVLDAAGEHREDRNFLVAAIVATTEPDPEDLAARLRRYRLIKVHEALLGEYPEDGETKLRPE